jgi:hypothetical protein
LVPASSQKLMSRSYTIFARASAQIDVEFARDLQVIGGPGVALGIEQVHPAAARDRNQGIGFGSLAIELRRLEVHAGERSHDFEMAQFFGADIHQKVFAIGIFAV